MRLAGPLGLAVLLAMAVPAAADSYFAFTGTIHVGSAQDGGVNTSGRGRQTLSDLALGLDFDVAGGGILLTHLGLWDDNGDGLGSAHDLAVYDTETRTLLAGTSAVAGGGDLHDGFRYFPLATSLFLPAGAAFTIVVHYPTGNVDSNGNSGRTDQHLEPNPVFHDGGGLIINVSGGRWGFGDSFPLTNDTGPANRYHSGSFAYALASQDQAVGPEPSTLALVVTALGGFGLVLLRRRR